ncbi:TIGR03936 family radical SAM-associated protein [Suilimivivens sp.]|uniref:TIGR03936 family radical SAM-associated protein n=1 Tax=Suilimivivens sp. TaxID=2981669 RepID=UPI00307A5330
MKVRIKFSKEGPVRFIGHLDIMRYFQKAIRRAGIDIAYSTGFSPHQIMSFASPLSVGHESCGEYFDVELNSITDTEDIKMRLNQTMAEGIQILQVAVLDETEGNAMASVAAADYLISFRDSVSLPDDWKEKLTAFYEKDKIPVIKKTKKGEREIDLKETIYQLEIREDQVYMLLDAGSGSNMKPGFVLETFCTAENISLPEYPFRVRRLETYKRTGEERLVPLIP